MASVHALAVALFNASIGGYKSDMEQNTSAYFAAAGAVLEKDLTSNAAFVDHLLSNFGVATNSVVFLDARAALLGLVQGNGREAATKEAINFLSAQTSSSLYFGIATAFAAKVAKAEAFTRANANERDVSKLIAAVTNVDTDEVALQNAANAARIQAEATAAQAAVIAKAQADAALAAVNNTGFASEQAAFDAARAAGDAALKAAQEAAATAAANAKVQADAALAAVNNTTFASEQAAFDAAKAAGDAAVKAAQDAAAQAAIIAKLQADAALRDAQVAAQQQLRDAQTQAQLDAFKAQQDLTNAQNALKAVDNTTHASEQAAFDAAKAAGDQALALAQQQINALQAQLNALNVAQNVTLTSSVPSVTEGDAGTKNLTFVLRLDKAYAAPVVVNYFTDGGTATAGDDYETAAGAVTFAAGQTSAIVNVVVKGDTAIEANETIRVEFSGAALINTVTATGTITNDDQAQQEQNAFTISSAQIASANATNVPVTLDVGNTGSKTVTIQSDGASATAGIIINGDANTTINSGASADRITVSGNGNNTITTGGGNDTVTVFGSGNNTINVGTGNDTVVGGTGSDTIVFASGALGEGDFVTGGAGQTTVRISGDGNVVAVDAAGVGAVLTGVESIVLDGTTLTIDVLALINLLSAGLKTIKGSSETSNLIISGFTVNQLLDLSTINFDGGGFKSISTNGAGAHSIVLTTQQAAAVEALAAVTGTLTSSIVVQGAQTVAEGAALIASGVTASFALKDTAANLALAPTAVFNKAISIEATTVATAAQAAAIAATDAASTFTATTTNLKYSVSDTASMLANYASGLGNATAVTATTDATVAEAAAIATAVATGTVVTTATYAVKDTVAAILAGVGVAGTLLALNSSSSVTINNTVTDVANITTINNALNGSAGGLTKVANGYNVSDAYADITGATTVANAAGSITVTDAISVANALTIESLTNTGTKSYALSDAATALLAASSAVTANASAVVVTGGVINASQANNLAAKFGTAKLMADTITVTDTAANLLTLSPAAITVADTVSTPTTAATVQQLDAIRTLLGAKAPAATNISDSAANVAAAVAVPASLANMDAVTGTMTLTGQSTVSQVKAINTALAVVNTGHQSVSTYSLTDTAANLAVGADSAIVDGAAAVTINSNATVAQITAINTAMTVAPDVVLGYTLEDTAGNTAAGGAAITAVDNAAKVIVTGASTVAQIATIAASFTTTDGDAVLGTDIVYSIDDTYALATADNAAAATLLAATTVTVTDSVTNLQANGVLAAIDANTNIDTLVVSDALAALTTSRTGGTAVAAADRIIVSAGLTDITVNADVLNVNALTALKPTTYTLSDAYSDISAQLALTGNGQNNASGAVSTFVANAKTITLTAAVTVANYNALDSITAAAIVAPITDTIANLTAPTGASALGNAITNSSVVAFLNGTTTATVSQAATLIAAKVPGATIATLDIVDTAANIQASASTLLQGVDTITVSDNGALTLSVLNAAAIFDNANDGAVYTNGIDESGSSYGNYRIVDTVANLVAANPDSDVVKYALSVTATDTANAAQAITLAGLSLAGTLTYSVSDTAAAVAGAAGAALNKATNITATGNATVDESEVIFAATNTGTKTFSVTGAAANYGITGAANDFASAAIRASILNAAKDITVTDTTDTALANILLGASNTGTTSITGVTDTAAKVSLLSLGAAENIVTITANTAATVVQATALVALDDANTTVVYNVTDTAANLAVASAAVLNTATNITASTTATAAEAAIISAATPANGNTTFSVSDTAANLAALAANVLTDAAAVTATTAATVAQAVKIAAGTVPTFSITDSFANLMNNGDVLNNGVDAAAAIAGATTVTVTDTALTGAQAIALRGVSGTPTYVYSIQDNDAAIVGMVGGNSVALAAATSVTGSQGSVIKFATVGTGNTFGVVGTKTQLDNLSTALSALNRIYEVNVADLEANPNFYSSLTGTQFLRVTDTAANLLSGNALLASARELVATGTVTAAQAAAIHAVSGVDTTKVVVADTSTALAAISANGLNNATSITATTAATVAEAATLIAASASAANTVFSVSDTAAAIHGAAANVRDEAVNITTTAAVASAAHTATLLASTNKGTTTITAATATATEAVAFTFNATGDDVITTLTVTTAATVEQASAIAADKAAGDVVNVTYSIQDSAIEIAKASAATLNGATAIDVNTGRVSVALAATLDAAAATDANTTYELADTAANILSASAASLARGNTHVGGEGNVVWATDTVSVATATQLRALDAANNTVAGNQTAAFQIAGANAAGNAATVGSFRIVDSYANLMPLDVAGAAVVNAQTVTVTDNLNHAKALALDTAVTAATNTLTFNLSDSYANLSTGTLGLIQQATDVTISGKISANQAVTALTFDGAAGDVIYTVRDSASSIATVLAGGSANAVTGAVAVEVTGAASVAAAARLSEVSKISYTISDNATNIMAAFNTVNDTAGTQDRDSIVGATSVTVTGVTTVAQALGGAANNGGANGGVEARGIYTISNVTYSITDTGAAIAAGLRGTDAAGIANATSVALTAGNYSMGVDDAVLIFNTLGDKFIKADHDANALTPSIYSITDTQAKIEAADIALIQAASVVTINATNVANVIDVGGFSRGLTINADAGNDTIFGTSFADVIIGGDGADAITLGDGNDVVIFNSLTGADTIADYDVAADSIQLSKAVFTSLAANVGDATLGAEFTTVANAAELTGGSVADSTDAQDFIFLRDTGALYYNADGATAGNLVLIGTFQGGALLVANEFSIIA